MLLLVFSDRDEVWLIEENVSGHEDGISEKTCIDVILVTGRFILKLSHPRELSEHGVAVEHPCELGMGGNMGLEEQDIFLRVETAGDILSQLLEGTFSEFSGVLTDGNRVEIGHEIVAFIVVDAVSPILYSSEIVAKVEITARLYSRKHSFLLFFHI